MSDILDTRVEEAETVLFRLRQAKRRRARGEKCAAGEHVTKCHNVVCDWSGTSTLDLLRELGLSPPIMTGGYQIRECLACGAWLVLDYCCHHTIEVTRQVATRLLERA